jgi:hypothetical protein
MKKILYFLMLSGFLLIALTACQNKNQPGPVTGPDTVTDKLDTNYSTNLKRDCTNVLPQTDGRIKPNSTEIEKPGSDSIAH